VSPVEAATQLNAREREVWRLLAEVSDPEIPVLSIVDLGIVREVRWRDTLGPLVRITPTYTGCPASEVIRAMIVAALQRAGLEDARVETVLAPPWSSAWLSEAGRRRLAQFGIAPPDPDAERTGASPACPRCASRATRRVAEFGSTPCKAHYQCTACLEPFDYFKCY
jgi:ring-1,2-phenylacetyl-CoA epoxidase subunit PaaD